MMKKLNSYTKTNTRKWIEIKPDQYEWGRTDKVRFLLVAINVPMYYSLPVRILSLMINGSDHLYSIYDTKYIEFENTESQNLIVKKIEQLKPDIIGFSINIWNRDLCFGVMKCLKQRLPETINIAGGQEVTNSVIDYLREYPEIDYIIDGEGELPLSQFLENWNPKQKTLLNLNKVSGLGFRKNGKTVFTGNSDLLQSLDQVPSPILNGLIDPKKKYLLGTMIEGTRGCPFRCSFCFEGGKKVKVRTASVEKIHKEAEYMASNGVKYFHIMDPILCNRNLDRLKQFSKVFKTLNEKYKNIIVSVEAYAHQITSDIADCLKEFTLIDIGLQTCNPETAKTIHRPISLEKFKTGLKHLRKNNSSFTIYLICGLPYETFSTYLKGIDQVLKENPFKVFFNELLLLNGTELRHRCLEYGYNFDKNPPYTVYSTKWMSEGEIKTVQVLSKAIEKKYNLSARAIYPMAPWIPKEIENHKEKIVVYSKSECSHSCENNCRVRIQYDSKTEPLRHQTQQFENKDIELICGDMPDKKELLKKIGQLQILGASRMILTAPPSVFFDKKFLTTLILRGVWHFKTFLSETLLDGLYIGKGYVSILNSLEHFNAPFQLPGYAMIRPYFELIILPGHHTTEKQYLNRIETSFKKFISVITIPGNIFDRYNSLPEKELINVFKKGIENKIWIKLPKKVWENSYSLVSKYDDISTHLETLSMTSKVSGIPPCFKNN